MTRSVDEELTPPDPDSTGQIQAGTSVTPARKRAAMLASTIEREIMRARWPIGQLIGNERELMDRYGVSRAIFREAVRILELHRVVTMRTGAGGGLVVSAPDVTALTRAATLYLDYEDVSISDLYDARLSLELQAVERTVQNLDEEGIERLREALLKEESDDRPGEHSYELHRVLADLSGNPAIKLFVNVLVGLTGWRISAVSVPTDVLFPKEAVEESHRAHRALVDAIVAGDLALAVHRMRAHMNGIHRSLPSRDELPHPAAVAATEGEPPRAPTGT